MSMGTSRRSFIRYAGLAGLSMAGGGLTGASRGPAGPIPPTSWKSPGDPGPIAGENGEGLSIIGPYGPWAVSRIDDRIPAFSFRRKEWTDLHQWRLAASARVKERMAIPEIGPLPGVTVKRQYVWSGLHIEELSWRLPYGRPTEAVLLKPAGAKAPLPGILAFHDHGGNKYFGTRKITRTGDDQHPLMKEHQADAYGGRAWANEIARRGYVVLVPDAFAFASRRVMLQDVPTRLRRGLTDADPEEPANIEKYNDWAGDHEHIMARSLFSAGTTWPGVFLAEDRVALDVLSARPDVDKDRIGCGGLSGGGLRTVFTGGLDGRIRCAACVGFMTTWRDFALNRSFMHTWMTYVPLLPNELDFPEILGLRAPLPTLVLNDTDDALYTLPEMKAADRVIQDVYKKAGASERYRCSFYPGGHKFDGPMQDEAFDWFDKWLK
jgi:dienelactone hydrolase